MQKRLTKPAAMTRYVPLLLLPLLLAGPAPARADDADDNDAPATPQMDPNLQWQIADTAWSRRQYDDAGSLMIAYADANPNGDNALEALWRAFHVYKSYRPNEDRKKAVFEKGIALAAKWTARFADSDKNRAARAMWYTASFYDESDQRVQALGVLADLVKRFPDTPASVNAYWTMAEWMRDMHQYAGAADNYAAYQKAAGLCENWNLAAFRTGICEEELHDSAKALAAYASVLDQPKNNWGWWQLGSGAIDAARRARALGGEDVCRKLAAAVMEKSPSDGGWADLQRQALQILGIAPAKKLAIVARIETTYETSAANLVPGGKVPVTRAETLLVKPRFFSPSDTFTATVALSAVAAPESVPATFRKTTDAHGGGSYGYALANPDAAGKPLGDTAFAFTPTTADDDPPDGLTVSRRFVKKGPDWGEETIRIQTSQHWRFWIMLPNNKTNPSNMSYQPDEVADDGRTFRWSDRADLSGGVTIRFPIEAGADIAEYYPAIRFEREFNRAPDSNASGVSATAKYPDFTAAVTTDKPIAFQVSAPSKYIVKLDEVSK